MNPYDMNHMQASTTCLRKSAGTIAVEESRPPSSGSRKCWIEPREIILWGRSNGSPQVFGGLEQLGP